MGLWSFFALIAWLSPIVLDDWFEVVWIRRHGLGLGSIWQYASYNYVNYNPRLGETLLLLVNGPRVIHVLLTPTVELALVWVVFALAHGRWPRASALDVRRLALAQALLWMVVPSVGVIYFYRPYVTNYLYGFFLQLALLVPYRFALGGEVKARGWWTPGLLVLGVAAGMTNEHTGPTAMLALALMVAWLWRERGRVQAWMIAGLSGLWIGYPLLFFAPGQTRRYSGAGAPPGPVSILLGRWPGGMREIVSSFLAEAQLAIAVVMVAVALAIASARARGAEVAAPSRAARRTMSAAIVAAGAIVATLLASPIVGKRLYFAPAVLVVLALAVAVETLWVERAARRFLACGALVVIGYFVVRATGEYWADHRAFEQRMAEIAAAPPGGVARVTPYRHWNESWLFFGDDLKTFTHRQYEAHEAFGLGGIELAPMPPWAEPHPPFELEYVMTFEPPMSEAKWRAAHDVPTFTASYVEWPIATLRRHLPALQQIAGHELVRVDVMVKGLEEVKELRGRPVRWLRWQDGRFIVPQGGLVLDEQKLPFFIVRGAGVVDRVEQAWVYACGLMVPTPMVPSGDGENVELHWTPWCKGGQIGIGCDDGECWLLAVTWR